MTKRTFISALVLAASFAFSQQSMAQNEYFVTTDDGEASENDSVPNLNLSPEQSFLNKNFHYRSVCDWTEGMRFMVIPGEKDTYLNAFEDSKTGTEIPTGNLKHKILVYKGHEITGRGWIHFKFVVNDSTQQEIYHEVRNLSFNDYCQKQANGGVPALAYLDEVDKAKELLIGKELYVAHEIMYKDDSSSRNGYRETAVGIDTKVKVTAVGVGTREYPVKIIVQDEQGRKFFQMCTLSHTNCGMNDNDFIAKNEQHLFDKAFSFSRRYADEEASTKADPTKNFSALPKTGPTSPTNSKYVNYAGLVSGMAEKGHSKDMVKMSKGTPDKKWTNRDGSVTWWYGDGTEITFSKKGIATRVTTTSSPSGPR